MDQHDHPAVARPPEGGEEGTGAGRNPQVFGSAPAETAAVPHEPQFAPRGPAPPEGAGGFEISAWAVPMLIRVRDLAIGFLGWVAFAWACYAVSQRLGDLWLILIYFIQCPSVFAFGVVIVLAVLLKKHRWVPLGAFMAIVANTIGFLVGTGLHASWSWYLIGWYPFFLW